MKTLIASCACVFGFAGMCHAAQIASPSIYGALSQTVALCLVYNAGSASQTVQVQIVDEAGTVVADSGNCTAFGSQFCSLAKIGISNGSAYACTARAGNVANLHGSMILEQGSGISVNALRSVTLR
jgi:hypothetical protein